MIGESVTARSYRGDDPADIVADEEATQAVRAAVWATLPDSAIELLDGSAEPLELIRGSAFLQLFGRLYPWSRQALDAV